MSLMQSVANIFRPTQQVTVAPAQPMAQVNPGADPAAVPPAGTSQQTQQQNPGPQAPSNPLDNFQEIWKTPDTQGNPDPLSAPLLNSDPKAIRAAASRMSFASNVSPDLLQKAMSGQDPQAFMQVLDAVAQNTLAASAQLTTATVENATRANNGRMLQALPTHVRTAQLAELPPDNAALQHAAAQPMLKLVRAQVQANNPNLSAIEVNRQAEAYLMQFATSLTSNSPEALRQQQAAQQQQAANPENFDWDSWVQQ